MSDERKRKYVEAIGQHTLSAGLAHLIADSVMTVADAEQAELEQALAEQGLANFALKSQMEAAQEDNQRLRNIDETWAEQCQHWQDVARAAEAKVARVEALLTRNSPMYALGEIRAALAEPARTASSE